MPKSSKSVKDDSKKNQEKEDDKNKKPTPNLSVMILNAITKLFMGESTRQKISQIIKEEHDIDIGEHLGEGKPLTRSATNEARNDQRSSASSKKSGGSKRKVKQNESPTGEEGQNSPKRAKAESGDIDASEADENAQVMQNIPILEEEGLVSEDIEQAVQDSAISSKASKKSSKNSDSSGKNGKKLSNQRKSAGDGENEASAAENKAEAFNSHLPVKRSPARSGKTAIEPSETKGYAEELEKRKLSYKKKDTVEKSGRKRESGKKQPKRSTKQPKSSTKQPKSTTKQPKSTTKPLKRTTKPKRKK